MVVEVNGHRREDAREKKATMGTRWVSTVNALRALDRDAFAEPTESDRIESALDAEVARTFDAQIAPACVARPALSA